ncbi:unnamed protein product [Dovyalis caffra]|uniref:DUF4283 domain-containing protein n=1 Tax=Dovyalis caffra TaxID=77055 RepID=A0AAV1RMK6_9ROSI|nr:unnamed protein product [Dovyalis caffra]
MTLLWIRIYNLSFNIQNRATVNCLGSFLEMDGEDEQLGTLGLTLKYCEYDFDDADDLELCMRSYGEWLQASPRKNRASFNSDNFGNRVMGIRKTFHKAMQAASSMENPNRKENADMAAAFIQFRDFKPTMIRKVS